MNYEQYTLSAEEKNESRKWKDKIDFIPDQEGLDFDITIQRIEDCLKDEKNFLGEGGAGKVFNIGGQCIKMLKNRSQWEKGIKMNIGNSPKKEFEIQARLNNFSSNDVFSPRVVRYYSGEKSAAIVMQRLEAVNLQLALNGEEKFPPNFDASDFFFRLEGYISEMHDRIGIAHGDLEPRNVMIDIKTGLPIVIDFGRSILKEENEALFDELAEVDFDNINKASEKVEEFLDKKRNIG